MNLKNFKLFQLLSVNKKTDIQTSKNKQFSKVESMKATAKKMYVCVPVFFMEET